MANEAESRFGTGAATSFAVGSTAGVEALAEWKTAGDSPGLIRGEKQRRAGNVLRLADAPRGMRSVTGWLREHGPEMGRAHASEFARHVYHAPEA